MAVRLTEVADEESTYVVTAAFTDEDGTTITPDTLTWTLTQTDGTVVNSRSAVVVASPAASEDIVLKGDDLAILEGERMEERIVTIEATYSSGLGSGLPLKSEIHFHVRNLKAVT